MSTPRFRLLSTLALGAVLGACDGSQDTSTNTGADAANAGTDDAADAAAAADASPDPTGDAAAGDAAPPAPDPADPTAADAADDAGRDGDGGDDGDDGGGGDNGDDGDRDAAASRDAQDPDAPARSGPDIADPEPVGDPALDRLVAFIRAQQIDRGRLEWRTRLPKPPLDAVEFDRGKTYTWTLRTNHGELKFRFLTNVAPKHVANAAYLTLLGYYDGLTFHRVLKGFMAQGGCPVGDGTGDPGYSLDGEFVDFVQHDRRGLLSTANSGTDEQGRGTDGSQFFILFDATPHLDGKHTIFGGLIGGRDTLRRIEALAATGGAGTPSETIVIESASVEVEGDE